MSHFRLVCLGTPQLFAPNGDPISVRTKKNIGLLTYLAVEPSVRQGRDRLAELLWPDSNDRDAKHSLATALSVLRGKLGPRVFESRRDSVRLLAGHILTDVEEVLSTDLESTALLKLEPFLGDFMIYDSPSFAQWVDRERARLLPLLQNQLGKAVAEAKSNGDSGLMSRLAYQLRRFDLLSEFATRTLLEARAMEGDRIGGLREYARWCQQISDDLGALPSRELADLANRIRHNLTDRVVPALKQISLPEGAASRPFVGRSREFQRCHHGWTRSSMGVPHHILLLGDPGVGKSALTERIVTVLTLEGARTLTLQAHPVERELPYSFLCQLVKQLSGLPGAGATPTNELSTLARIVTAISDRWPAVAPNSPVGGEEVRAQLTHALIALVTSIADESPLAIVIDDFHCADTASSVIIQSALHHTTGIPVFFLLSASLGTLEAPRIQPEDVNAETILLEPLRPEDSRKLLEELLIGSRQPDSSVSRAILGAADGNPLAIGILLSNWLKYGSAALPFTLGSPSSIQEPIVDNRFRSLISRVVDSLDADSRKVAELAAVLGSRLEDFSFYSILELRPARILHAIAALTNLRILRDIDGKLVFSNELIRSECYHRLPASIRRTLHSVVADKLETMTDVPGGVNRLEIAWHLVRAERTEDAVDNLLRGGRDAIRRGAPHEAELAITMGLPYLHGAPREEATSLLAEALQELGKWNDSLRVLGIPHKDSASDDSWKEVLRAIARRWGGDQNTGHLITTTSRLLAIASSADGSQICAGAISTLPYFLSHTHDEQGLIGMGKVLDTIEATDLPPYESAQVFLARAWWLERHSDREAAALAISQAETIIGSEGIGNTLAARVAIGNGLLHSLKGQYQDAIPLLERAATIAKQIDNPVQIAAASASLATAYGRLGNYQLQVERAQVALAALPPTDCSMLAIAATYEQAMGLEFLGETSDALRASDGLALRCHRGSPTWAVQAILLMQADIAALAGDDRGSYSFARKAVAISRKAPLNSDLTGLFARWLAKTAIRSGNASAAIAELQRDTEAIERLHSKDQSELIASLAILEEHVGTDASDLRRRLHSKLEHLPRGIHSLLRRLGFLTAEPILETAQS